VNYSTVYGEAWDSRTAKQCRGNPVRLALFAYLMANGHTNMIGVFKLPVAFIQYDLGLPQADIEDALQFFADDGFIVRDVDTDYIFVTRMADVRMQLDTKPAIDKKDSRWARAMHLYTSIPTAKLAQAFYQRYATKLRLPERTFSNGNGHNGNGHKPEPLPIADDRWQAVMDRIEVLVNRHTFHTWFKPIVFDRATHEAFCVRVPNDTFPHWLTKHHSDIIQRAITEAGAAGMTISYAVDESLALQRRTDVRRVRAGALASSRKRH
jgi:hypothetical protein